MLAALAAAGLLAGSAARAEDPAPAADADAKDEDAAHKLSTQWSEIELGFFWNDVDGEPSNYAQYRGLDDDQFYALANVDIFRRAAWDSQSTEYFRLGGQNLGLTSRSVDAEYGHQGVFGVSFLYDQLPVYKTQTAQSFFLGTGSNNLTLPSTWVPGTRGDDPFPGATTYPTAFQTSILTNEDEKEIGWERRKIGGGLSFVLPANMEFLAGYSYETKKGDKLIGSAFGTNGGNPRSVIIPERIDYHTHQFDGALRYNGDNLQLGLEYLGSAFDDDEDFQRWQNPYVAGALPASAGYCSPVVAFCGTGQRSQAPDNWFHEVIASGGYNFSQHTRATLRTAFSWMTQDDDFLPYTINPALTATTPGGVATNGADLAALPRTSLDGEIFTSIVDFGIASRPMDKLRLDTGYRWEKRDNNTPRDLYIYIPSDSANQGTVDGATARINRPYSLTRQNFHLDLGYSLPMRTEAGLGYEWELTDRDYQEVDHLQSNTVSATLTSRPSRALSTRLIYEHTWRDGSSYDGAQSFIDGFSTEHIEDELAGFADPTSECATLGLQPEQCLFENHPLLRKYYLADLSRDKISVLLTFVPLESLTLSMNLNYWDDDYYDSDLGLTSSTHLSPGLDLAYTPNEWVSLYTFYTYERRESDSTGWERNATIAQASDPTRRWVSDETDFTHTVGVGFNAAIIPERLDVGVDYVYSTSRGEIESERIAGSTLPAISPFPDLLSQQHNVSVHAEYHFTDQFSTRVGYLYQYLKTEDWAYDDLGPTSLTCSATACVIGTGQESPHYSANMVTWSIIYKFW